MKVKEAFNKIIDNIKRILFGSFGKYGSVVTKQDWKRIKKTNRDVYKQIWSRNKRCYEISHLLACELEGAKLLYCSKPAKDSKRIGCAVVLKNNCIYDTDARKHYDCQHWINENSILFYKIFEEKDYRNRNFFNNIRKDFNHWCKVNNVDSVF